MMKTVFAALLAAAVAWGAASLLVTKRLTALHLARTEQLESTWQLEKNALEADLEKAAQRPSFVAPTAPPQPAQPALPASLTAPEIIAKLLALKSSPGETVRGARQAIYWLEGLIAAGPAALPAIRDYLSRNEDVDLAPVALSKAARAGEFLVPPTLRLGLLEAAKRIGGTDSEILLAEVLNTTRRGSEIAWLSRALDEMAPDKYRDAALAAARDLLAGNAASPANDRGERDQLFGVLTMFGDTSFVSAAQAQLLRADGGVDRSALKYLQQTLGPQAVALAAQLYDDPRITDPANKEPFARLALNYVGVDPQANEFYQRAINDLKLSARHRKDLIEDLNQDGFTNPKKLTAADLPLVQNRIALIEQLAPRATDPVNMAAFSEAYKDLINMRERLTRAPQ